MAVCGDPYNLGILEWELPLGKLGTVGNAQLLSAMMAVGPIVMGCAMLVIFNDRKSWRWPFHKDKVVGSFGFHLVVGWMVAVWPVYLLGMACFGQSLPLI